MITVRRTEPGSSNFCQGCPNKATYSIVIKKTRRGTGELLKHTYTVLTLCATCLEELLGGAALFIKKDYVEAEHEREYDL